MFCVFQAFDQGGGFPGGYWGQDAQMAPPLMNQMVRMATMGDGMGMEYRSAPRRLMNRDRPLEYGLYGMMDDSVLGKTETLYNEQFHEKVNLTHKK